MIRIRILGSAAGGGLPQWNCACLNCRAARAGKISARTQSSIALSGDGHEWLLINASPDLPAQIEAFAPLQPRATPPRNSPIVGACLTNPDIDHVLGLVSMRQSESLVVYATPPVRHELRWIDNLLARFCQIDWREPRSEWTRCLSDVDLHVIDLGSSVAWVIRNAATNKQALIAPAVGDFTDELRDAMQQADAILFDGTFWSDDELKTFRANARTSREMGHIPVQASVSELQCTPAAHKIYVHINNTNPILLAESLERKAVGRAGIGVAHDGLELKL
ncbi:MAG: pyrroloquinoline quinone biosynthesis protein PqqB [Chthoniobacterales bacterium]